MKINLQSLSNTKLILIALTLVLVSFCCGATIVGFALSTTDTEQAQVVDRVITKVVEITVEADQEPYPTYTKVATQTRYPTYTPLPVAPVTSTPSTFVEVYRFTGSGMYTTDLFSLQKGVVKITWKFVGKRNFIVQFWDTSSGDKELLANEIDSIEGVSVLNVDAGNEYMIEVEQAEGSWEIIIEHKPLR